MYEHTHQFLNECPVHHAKSWWLCDGIAIKGAYIKQLSLTVVRSTGPVHFPRLDIGCRNPKRTISLSKVQPPFTFELNQTFSKHHPIDLTLSLLRRTRPKEWSLKPGNWPIRKFRLIRSSDNRVLDAGVDGRTEKSSGIDEHLADRVLTLRVADSARRHGVVHEQPGAITSLDWRWAGFEESIFPRMYWSGEWLRSGQGRPVEEIGRSSVVER